MTKKLSTEEAIASLSSDLALEVLRMIDDLRSKGGDAVAQAVTVDFLAAFTTASVVRALGDVSTAQSSRAQYEAASARFLAHKNAVQEAVAAGFQSAMSTFSGTAVEYYCMIKMVPDPVSRSLN